MAKILAGVVAVSIVALLFAGCGGGRTSAQSSTTTANSAQRSTAKVISYEDLEEDIVKLCRYARSLDSAVSEMESDLRKAGAKTAFRYSTPSKPLLNYRGIC